MSGGSKLLVVGPSWVGDMVMAQSLYRLLRLRSPDAAIDVIAPPWSLPVLARMPEVARGVELPLGHGQLGLGVRRALGKRLRTERYARAIVLPRSAKAALVPWFARVPQRTGFRGEWRFGLLNDMRPRGPELDQTVKRFVALGLDSGEQLNGALLADLTPRLDVDRDNLARLRRTLELRDDGPTVALMPGAEYGPAKRWPLPKFASLAAELARRGANVWVLGSDKERSLGAQLAATSGESRVRNLCGATSLADVVDLFTAADVAVTNDSGLMHVAAAAGTHVVALYGSSSPGFTPPLTARSTVFYLDLDCSPCFERKCPLGHLKCLHDISPAAVLAAVDAVLEEHGGGAPASLAGGQANG